MKPPIVPASECGSDGAELLDKTREALCTYVAFPSIAAANTVTLWIAATHAQQVWNHAPRLAVVSPIKRCGKSRLLDCVEAMAHEPLVTINASAAAVARSIIPDDPITLLIDEADTIFGSKKSAENHEDIRGIINAGYQRNRPYTRWDITTRAIEQIPTFSMAMLASIGDLPDTVMDRAVVIRMRRRAPSERVSAWRARKAQPPLRDLCERLHTWVRARLNELAEAEPEMPVEDRAADTWEPLVAVGDQAGGHWPESARLACVSLSEEDLDEGTAGERLLADMRVVFESGDRLATVMILDQLHEIDEAPWSDWYGKPLNPRALSRLLKPYGIRSKNVRLITGQVKGYERADFEDPWERYLRVPSVPGVPESQPDESADQARDGSGTEEGMSIRPHSEQGVFSHRDGGTHGTDAVREQDFHAEPVSLLTAELGAEVLTDVPPQNGSAQDDPELRAAVLRLARGDEWSAYEPHPATSVGGSEKLWTAYATSAPLRELEDTYAALAQKAADGFSEANRQ